MQKYFCRLLVHQCASRNFLRWRPELVATLTGTFEYLGGFKAAGTSAPAALRFAACEIVDHASERLRLQAHKLHYRRFICAD